MNKRINNIFLLGLLIIVFAATEQDVIAQPTPGLDDLVEPGVPERIAAGFTFTDGPVWHPDGYLLFTDIPANKIYKWTPDGKVETYRSPSGHSNGLTFDRKQRLIACEHSNRQISRMEADGTMVMLADKYEGKRLNSPNDVVVKSDESIYFTDPPYGLTSAYGISGMQELKFHGVYRLLPDGKGITLLVDDIKEPNGIAFSPDESVLYISSTTASRIYAFDVEKGGTIVNRQVFANVLGRPDGLKVDLKGNLYATNGSFKINIFNSKGTHLGDIVTPEPTSNCAFGGSENKVLFITARTSVYCVQLKVQGVPVVPLPN